MMQQCVICFFNNLVNFECYCYLLLLKECHQLGNDFIAWKNELLSKVKAILVYLEMMMIQWWWKLGKECKKCGLIMRVKEKVLSADRNGSTGTHNKEGSTMWSTSCGFLRKWERKWKWKQQQRIRMVQLGPLSKEGSTMGTFNDRTGWRPPTKRLSAAICQT